MADAAQIAQVAAFTVLFLIGTVLAILAYWSVRRMDQVVLKALMYMNRARLFNGLLAQALCMVILTIVIVIASVSQIFGWQSPPSVLVIGFGASFVFLAWGFYNFYALSRPPRGTRPQESGES